MKTQPIITFRATAPAKAAPRDVYRVLADPSTHLEWAGEQSPREDFKLLSLDAPTGLASKATRFDSTGASSKNGSMTFHDRSTVTEATPGRRFAFDTDSTLERKHRPTWRARFVHTYDLNANGTFSGIDYTCEVYPQNYRPWWLHPLMRPITRQMVQRVVTKNLENLARMSERKSERTHRV